MPKLVLKSRKPLGQTKIVTDSQDKSSTRSSLDVCHDVSSRACAVFVNVTGSHVTFHAREFHVLCDVHILSPRALFTPPTQRECTKNVASFPGPRAIFSRGGLGTRLLKTYINYRIAGKIGIYLLYGQKDDLVDCNLVVCSSTHKLLAYLYLVERQVIHEIKLFDKFSCTWTFCVYNYFWPV